MRFDLAVTARLLSNAPAVPHLHRRVARLVAIALAIAASASAQSIQDPALAKALAKCQSTVTKAQSTYGVAAAKSYKACVDGVFNCLQVKASDVGCLSKATFACDKQLARVDAAGTSLKLAIEKRCGAAEVPFATLMDIDGADVGAVAYPCTAFDVPVLANLGDWEECLVRAGRCAAEDLARFGTPRAEELFALIGRELRSDFCPTPPATPTPTASRTPTPIATATITASPTVTGTPSPVPTGPGGETPTPPPTPTATSTPVAFNRVFVTSATHSATFGGLAGADAFCQTTATNAGLGGTWTAWLSDATTDAKTRLGTAQGFVRLDGRPFANAVADIIANKIFTPLRIDEHGADVGTVDVWTGTDADGTASTATCSSWSSTSGSTETGTTGGGPDVWTAQIAQSCGGSRHLYCFETSKILALTPNNTGNVVFVTNGLFTPGGGIAAADALCNSEAGGLGTYIAFLATTTQSAAGRTVLSVLNKRKDNVFVGSDTTIAGGGPLVSGIWQTATGAYVTSGQVWTGAATPSALGTAASTCNDWTLTTSTTGIFGRAPFADATWWNTGTQNCSTASRLYCVPQ